MKLLAFARFYCIWVLLVTGLWVGDVSAQLPTPSACTSMPSVYSALLDFEPGWLAGTNPNGVWSYGWSADLTAPITLFSRNYIAEDANWLQHLWDDPEYSDSFAPSVARNSGGDYDDGNVSWGAGKLGLHHGPGGTYAHVIFTAPSSGLYAIAATFYAQQYGIDVDVHVLVNGKVHFSDTITNMPESRSFEQLIPLRAGQKVNFASGPNGSRDLHAGHTGLETVVARVWP